MAGGSVVPKLPNLGAGAAAPKVGAGALNAGAALNAEGAGAPFPCEKSSNHNSSKLLEVY